MVVVIALYGQARIKGAGKAGKKIQNIYTKQLPYAMSSAMRETVKKGAARAAEGATKEFSKKNELGTPNAPTKPLTRSGAGKKGTKTGGVFRYRWDGKRAIQGKGIRKANASVFVIKPWVEELGNQIFGRAVRSVPEKSKVVLTPTRALLKGLSGRGRLKRLNKFGNIANLWAGKGGKGGIMSDLKNNLDFLYVPLKGGPPQTAHLHAGLYLRVYKDNNTARARMFSRSLSLRDRRQRDERGRIQAAGGRESTLILLIAFERFRKYKKRFKYEQIVKREYSQEFGKEFNKWWRKALRTAK